MAPKAKYTKGIIIYKLFVNHSQKISIDEPIINIDPVPIETHHTHKDDVRSHNFQPGQVQQTSMDFKGSYRSYRCVICMMQFKCKSFVRKHMQFEHFCSFECDICQEQFCTHSKMKMHLMKNHVDKRKRKVIRSSPKLFTSSDSKESILQSSDQERTDRDRDDRLGDKKVNRPISTTSTSSSDQESFLPSDDLIPQHQTNRDSHRLEDEKASADPANLIHFFECELCQKRCKTSVELEQHLEEHLGNRRYKCGKCPASFENSTKFMEHIRSHSERPFKCKLCERGYNHRRNLERHVAIYHLGKRFKCNLCSFEFTTQSNLASHLLIHNRNSGDEPYSCVICSAKFARKANLTVHSRLHDRDTPFKCDRCPAAFKSESDLKEHEHADDKPYKCVVCSVGFKSQQLVSRHSIVHSEDRPFKCDVCPLTFKRKNGLWKHMKRHSNRRTVQCTMCPASFVFKHDLKKHMLVHTNATPFKCNVCSAAFKCASSMKRHMQTHDKKVSH